MLQQFMYCAGEGRKKFSLTDLKLFKEGNTYFFAATYRLEDDFGIKEIHFPKIVAPISNSYVAVTHYNYGRDVGEDYALIQLGDNIHTHAFCGGEHHAIFTETVIEEKTHEMTLDEIEKKLGYKVKIINKKE